MPIIYGAAWNAQRQLVVAFRAAQWLHWWSFRYRDAWARGILVMLAQEIKRS